MTDSAAALDALRQWWRREREDLPWRASRDRWAILVAEIMCQQTPARRAVPHWGEWMRRWPTPEACARAPLADILAVWKGLGYPRRARALWECAHTVQAHGWPEDLQALPGVGPYTAAAVALFADETPVLPVDVNISRILLRRFPDGIPDNQVDWELGQALMEFGQRICGRRPRCDECPLRQGCAVGEGGADPAPAPKRQARYEGSFRQRRGLLLARLLAEGEVPMDVDMEAAQSLCTDGLAREERGVLLPL